ncbi:MAG: gliding motility-associated C-terminal domain-containing protein [Bacteroidota bacterium]
MVCNSINTGYLAYLTLLGGDKPTYTINGSTANITSQGKYTSGLIPGGTPYNFTLSDKNGCLPRSVVSGTKNCNCTSDAGTMQMAQVNVCGSTPAVGTHNGNDNKDGNDVKSYILHDNSGRSLGRIIAVNNSAPVFTYNPAWGINYDQTYYISAVVGDPDPNVPQMVDTLNPNGCTSVSAGQPVAFHIVPQMSGAISNPQICLGDATDLVFTFTAGVEPFDVDFTTPSSASATAPARRISNNTWSVTPTSLGNNTYTLTSVTDANGCSTTLSIPLSVTVVDFPVTTAPVITCNSINTQYTVAFTISNGDAASYTVNNLAVSSASYTSSPISSGSPYSFDVADANQCRITTVSGTHTCPCISDAGSMTVGQMATPLEFCQTSPATAQHNGNQTFDGNDILSFILCTQVNRPVATLIKHSPTPSFAFDPFTMTTGTVYYIVPVAGDSVVGGNLTNLSSFCIDTLAGGTPVMFIAPPEVTLSGASEICYGGATGVIIRVKGNKKVRFTLSGSDGSSSTYTYNSVFTGFTDYPTTVIPLSSFASGTVNYSIGAAVNDSTLPQVCSGSASGSASVLVHPIPTATINTETLTICSGEQVNLGITTTGDGPLTTDYGTSAINSSYTAVAGSSLHLTPANLSPGTHLFTAKTIRDNTTAGCSNTGSGTTTVIVRSLPTASFTLSGSPICLNDQSAAINITPNPTGDANSSGKYTVYFKETGSNTPYLRDNLDAQTPYSYTFSPSTDGTYTYRVDSIVDATVSSASGRHCKTTPGTSVQLVVNPLPYGSLSGDTAICLGASAPITFTSGDNYNITAYYEVFNEETGQRSEESHQLDKASNSFAKSPSDTTTYTLLRLEDMNGCKSPATGSARIIVNPIPVPIIAATDTNSCPPLITTLQNLTDPSYLGQYTWHFGDGTTSTGQGADPGQAKSYTKAGSYHIRLEVTSPQGCYKDSLIEDFLTVYPFPEANFSWSPESVDLIEPTVRFRNLSQDNQDNHWSFYDIAGQLLDTSILEEPTYRFPDLDSGSYPVRLRVVSPFGCVDSITKTVYVDGVFEAYIPNSFTPNNDGVNDVFKVVLVGEAPTSFDLSIINRWGEVIFHTTNPDEGWEGIYAGEPCKPDVYIYYLKVRSKYSAQKKDLRGHVRILK